MFAPFLPVMRHIELNDGNVHVSALVHGIARELERTLAKKGDACLAVSGGQLPVPVFVALQQQPIRWDRVNVMLVDERMVPLSHADSNARLVCDVLLRNSAAQAAFLPPVPLYCADISDIDTSSVVAQLNRSYRQPDVVVLGMGEDGHTASLFPDAPELEVALSLAEAPGYLALSPRAAPHKRVSLNLRALLGARRVLLAFSGVWKRHVFGAATLQPSPAWPVSYLLHQTHTPVDVYWAP